MKSLKITFGLICLAILASNIATMSRWNEARGVYDDVCYLRQAHLFQRFGIGGLNTNAALDDDHYFQGKLKEIAYAEWQEPAGWPCHTPMPGDKFVLQYPPGTGALLALFPEGNQVVPLYVSASLIVSGLALFGIFTAPTLPLTLGAGSFGALAVYIMVNPGKASYSVAPTMAVCAAAGFLTAWWLVKARQRLWPVMLIGLLLGVSVNFRLPNALLAAGYFLFLGIPLVWSRKLITFAQGFGFGVAVLVGMAPTLIAQAVNAGSPIATTYGSADVVAPAFSLVVFGQYLSDMQFGLIALAIGSTAWQLRMGEGGVRQVALVAVGNLLVNLVFFLSHPVFTPYYVVPIAMLTLWSLSFAALMEPVKASEAPPLPHGAAGVGALSR
ncbi:hypothetical protein [Bradyrhizobium iriomotense]|uniref:Glycosyltransferase RgtA/B/C/D-like domain-containing protein n=1 Tax=Bradyrhizobium iriomotense TaxID=441950 RepID=A0ABQ6B2Y1_9BRAD|nr:hypothetical protein [Bradyrhizobium iriomotense]GLR88767.1 hypothetical protein GCM10007857_54800 [Bradyrhizobium iriomotense]